MTGHNRTQSVAIPIGRAIHEGLLVVPDKAGGNVLFSHGSGSGRLSPRNNFVAGTLRASDVASLTHRIIANPRRAVQPGTLRAPIPGNHLRDGAL